ncbi:hypothetical protein ACFPM0_23500 [Pseudonocardia sulfidoxydans]|uniref:hypothetical protein n=1 Tax=Pseudonocardia sulfidoxydans TaxID=54011 RepID=UPI00361865AB
MRPGSAEACNGRPGGSRSVNNSAAGETVAGGRSVVPTVTGDETEEVPWRRSPVSRQGCRSPLFHRPTLSTVRRRWS